VFAYDARISLRKLRSGYIDPVRRTRAHLPASSVDAIPPRLIADIVRGQLFGMNIEPSND